MKKLEKPFLHHLLNLAVYISSSPSSGVQIRGKKLRIFKNYWYLPLINVHLCKTFEKYFDKQHIFLKLNGEEAPLSSSFLIKINESLLINSKVMKSAKKTNSK